jgi:hypothetical protein
MNGALLLTCWILHLSFGIFVGRFGQQQEPPASDEAVVCVCQQEVRDEKQRVDKGTYAQHCVRA